MKIADFPFNKNKKVHLLERMIYTLGRKRVMLYRLQVIDLKGMGAFIQQKSQEILLEMENRIFYQMELV